MSKNIRSRLKKTKSGLIKNLNKTNRIGILSLIAIGFVAGLVVMFLYFQPKLSYQGKTATEWKNLYSSENKQLIIDDDCIVDPSKIGCFPFADATDKLNGLKRNCDQVIRNSGDIVWHYKNCPSPTPQIEYQTQYVPQYIQEPAQPQSTSSRCTPDYAGGEYCTSNTGVRTHCTSNYAGGFNCN